MTPGTLFSSPIGRIGGLLVGGDIMLASHGGVRRPRSVGATWKANEKLRILDDRPTWRCPVVHVHDVVASLNAGNDLLIEHIMQ